MTEKKRVLKKRINWQKLVDSMWPSDEEKREFKKAFEIDRRSLRIPFGPIDGSGDWTNNH